LKIADTSSVGELFLDANNSFRGEYGKEGVPGHGEGHLGSLMERGELYDVVSE